MIRLRPRPVAPSRPEGPSWIARSGSATPREVGVERHPDAFSRVILHPDGRGITLSVDPFGNEGAAYTRTADGWACASDPRLLLNSRPVLDAEALHGYLCLSHIPTPLTPFEGIRAVPAGARLSLPAPVSESAWADFTSPASPISDWPWEERPALRLPEEEAAAELLGLLEAAVLRQCGGSREVGVFLSGGLDSSVVAALLVRAGVRTHLFSLDFGDPYNAELEQARGVAEHLGRPLTVVPAGPKTVLPALEPAFAALHAPFADGVILPLYLLGRAAAEQVDVVFNGEGGDQLFGGWANKPLIAAEMYADAGYDRTAAYLETYHRFHGLEGRYYTEAARRLTRKYDPGEWVRPALDAPGFSSLLHRLRAANLRLKGAQNIAPRATQLAAAHGLRLCSPFLDRALAQWSFSLPPDWLLRGACEKHLLKRAMERLLPAEVVWQAKRGMGVPVSDWLAGCFRREVAGRLSPGRVRREGWLRPEAVRELIGGELWSGEFRRRRPGERLWALLALHVWCDVQPSRPEWPTAGM